MIPLLMAVFARRHDVRDGGGEPGVLLLVITVMIAAGYDSVTGAAIVLLGCGIGTLGSTINPFATGIASGSRMSR